MDYKEKKIGGHMSEIDVQGDLTLLEAELKTLTEQLQKLEEQRVQLITKLQQLQGAAAYLRGKQEPTPDQTVAEALEEKTEEESTDNE
jgi:hypothetical protein|tara:strand:+ start:436 stop:699 length:264 start_codon:yes stop_codon:yes gene_type:complete